MILLFLFAFLSGMVMILAPCIWPILPIILSSGTGGERRPLGIVTGLVVSFSIFTLLFSYILSVVPLHPDTFRLIAALLIALLGLTMLVPALGQLLDVWIGRFSHMSGGVVSKKQGFKGGFVAGAALGVVWSPCAGPILATVGTLAATQSLSLPLVLVTLSFTLGFALPLYGLALVGQHLLTRTRALSPYTGIIRQVFGVAVILSALAIYTGYDLVLQTKFSEFCAENGINFLSSFQTNPIVKEELEALREGGSH